MSILRRINTLFGFKVQDGKLTAVNRRVATTKRRMKHAAREAKKFRANMNLAANAAKGMFLVMAGSAIVKSLTTDYSQAADAIAKFSAATGLSTDFIQRFYHAMELGGATQAESEKGLKKFIKTVNDSKRGLKTAKDAFKEIGVDPDKITADREGLLKLADAMEKNKKPAVVAAAAQDIFGKAALKFIPTMKKGRKAMQAYFDEADRLGKVMSKKRLAEAEEFNDQLLRAKVVVTGLRNQIAARLLPTLINLLTRFSTWARQGDNLKRTLERVKLAAKAAAAALALFITIKLVKTLNIAAQGFMALARSIWAVDKAALAAKIKVLAILALLALIPLIIQDLVVFAQGGDSLIGRALGDTKVADDLREDLLDIGKELSKAWAELKPALLEAWKEMVPALKEVGKELKPLIPLIIKGLIGSVKMMIFFLKLWPPLIRHAKRQFKAVARVVGAVIRFIVDGWRRMTTALNDDTRGVGRVFAVVLQVIKGLISGLKAAWLKMVEVVGPILKSWVDSTVKKLAVLLAIGKIAAKGIGKAFAIGAQVAKAAWRGVLKMIAKAASLVSKVKGVVGKGLSALGIGGGSTEIKIPTLPGPTLPSSSTRGGTTQTTTATVGKLEVNVQGSTAMGPGELGQTVRQSTREALQDIINQAARNVRGATT